MKLVIVHSHFRPGGVRRVIELGSRALAAAGRPRFTEIVLAGGEPPASEWLASFRRVVPGCPVVCAIDPALGYWSEQRRRPAERIRADLATHLGRVLGAFAGGRALVWAHNPGLGRNLPLARALAEICTAKRVPLVFHHHDWWFDNRWARWPEMQRAGFHTLRAVAAAMLPRSEAVRHACINQADATVLARHFGAQAGWIPNPAAPAAGVSPTQVTRARRWLERETAGGAAVWLMPCRLLRRKNIAEGLLLTRWLRPGAWLVTTGGVTSADEQAYAAALGEAARRHRWRLRLGVLAGDESAKPGVPALVAASEALLLTSLQEGFGLPYVEAAAAGRPLIARTLPGIAPDLARFGFRFPQAYDDVQIVPALFDARAEMRRQAMRWRAWRQALPAGYRLYARKPEWLENGPWPETVPFSRLSLTAQLEVLTHPPADSWASCAPHNPWLVRWRRKADSGKLDPSPWPRASTRWISGDAFARAMQRLLRTTPDPAVDAEASRRAMDEFVRAKLAPTNQYPLLWLPNP